MSTIRIGYLFINLYLRHIRCRDNRILEVKLMVLGDLVTPIFGAALQESLQIGIKLALKLLAKLIGKLLNGRRVVDVALVEGISVITTILRLVVAQHVTSRLDLDVLLLL